MILIEFIGILLIVLWLVHLLLSLRQNWNTVWVRTSSYNNDKFDTFICEYKIQRNRVGEYRIKHRGYINPDLEREATEELKKLQNLTK
jgi:hypothetical protein